MRRLAFGHVLMLGDFNAISVAWGSPGTVRRSSRFPQWAVAKLAILDELEEAAMIHSWLSPQAQTAEVDMGTMFLCKSHTKDKPCCRGRIFQPA